MFNFNFNVLFEKRKWKRENLSFIIVIKFKPFRNSITNTFHSLWFDKKRFVWKKSMTTAELNALFALSTISPFVPNRLSCIINNSEIII